MSSSIVDDIKESLDIVDVVSETVTLSKSNGDIYTGSVGTPGKTGKSLHVDRGLQLYYDFKNGKGGDVLNWIAQAEGIDIQNDFTEIIRIGADKAGIDISSLNGNSEKAAEKRDIFDLYTHVADIYHSNMTDEMKKYIEDKWGIDGETIDRMKIGIAPGVKSKDYIVNQFLKDDEKELLIKSGLVHLFKNGQRIDHFNGRIVFPYWKNGKVVYFIARAKEGLTEKNKYECHTDKDGNIGDYIKYKKLLTPGQNHPFVSDIVGNNYLFGEDSARKGDYCIITEGVTDCITANAAGFSCISPVTVQFREADYEKLYNIVKNKEIVYICNDSEINEAGIKGAIKTAQYLEKHGVTVKMVLLDRGDKDKIDLAEYLRTHKKEEFSELLDNAIYIIEYQLMQIKPSKRKIDCIKQAKTFCEDNLAFYDETEAHAFLRNDLKEHFGFTKQEIDDIVKWYKQVNKRGGKRGEAEEGEEDEESVSIQLDEEHLSPEEITKAKVDALEIMKSGNPMDYMCNTIKKIHIGDDRAIEGLNIAIANQSCLNTQGIQIKLSGDSGGGKSHLAKSCCHCLRNNHIIESSLSAKAAYYMPLKPGTLLFSDDTEISEDMETVIKRSTTNYQDQTTHTTVKDGNSMTLQIPPRILWLITSVEDEVSDQLLNRQLIFNVDTSSEQKKRIFEMQRQEALDGEIKTLQVTHEVLVCREMWDIIKGMTAKVRVPFADDIDTMDKSNSRNFPMFMDMVKGYTLLNHMQRETDEDNYILATKEDFYAAKALFESQTDSVLTKLNEKERLIIQVIGQCGKEGADINQIVKATDLSYQVVRNALKGRANKPGGLLDKVKKLKLIESNESVSVEEEEGLRTTKSKKRDIFILDSFNGWDIFDTGFVFLKSERDV